jgi:hypothetical protein
MIGARACELAMRAMQKGEEKRTGIDGMFTGRNGGAHTKHRM